MLKGRLWADKRGVKSHLGPYLYWDSKEIQKQSTKRNDYYV